MVGRACWPIGLRPGADGVFGTGILPAGLGNDGIVAVGTVGSDGKAGIGVAGMAGVVTGAGKLAVGVIMFGSEEIGGGGVMLAGRGVWPVGNSVVSLAKLRGTPCPDVGWVGAPVLGSSGRKPTRPDVDAPC